MMAVPVTPCSAWKRTFCGSAPGSDADLCRKLLLPLGTSVHCAVPSYRLTPPQLATSQPSGRQAAPAPHSKSSIDLTSSPVFRTLSEGPIAEPIAKPVSAQSTPTGSAYGAPSHEPPVSPLSRAGRNRTDDPHAEGRRVPKRRVEPSQVIVPAPAGAGTMTSGGREGEIAGLVLRYAAALYRDRMLSRPVLTALRSLCPSLDKDDFDAALTRTSDEAFGPIGFVPNASSGVTSRFVKDEVRRQAAAKGAVALLATFDTVDNLVREARRVAKTRKNAGWAPKRPGGRDGRG